jgi:hypothetical protein
MIQLTLLHLYLAVVSYRGQSGKYLSHQVR